MDSKNVRPAKGEMLISVLADGTTWTECMNGHGCHVAIVKSSSEAEMGDADEMEYRNKWEIRWKRNKKGFLQPFFVQVL